MLVSKPDCEKRQISAALVPEAGRVRATGFPPRLQPFVEVLKAPRAATLRSKEAEELSTPAVVGSTTAIFLPEIERDGVVSCAGSDYDERDDVGESTGGSLHLNGDVGGLHDVGAVDRGGAGVCGGASGDARSAGDQESGAGTWIGGDESAAVHG